MLPCQKLQNWKISDAVPRLFFTGRYVIHADNLHGPWVAVHVFTNRFRHFLEPRLWCLILGFCAPIRCFDVIDPILIAYWWADYWLRVLYLLFIVNRDSVVGIATFYGLGNPRTESRCGRDFLHPSKPAPGPIQPPMQLAPGLYWE
jgi:hypothetical protein